MKRSIAQNFRAHFCTVRCLSRLVLMESKKFFFVLIVLFGLLGPTSSLLVQGELQDIRTVVVVILTLFIDFHRAATGN
jgi:hypothetical protein